MKALKIYFSLLALIGISVLQAQVTTEPAKADEIDPEATLKITVDIYALDQSKDYVQNLIEDAEAGMDLYIWTWSPKEHSKGHPLQNGLGAEAWKNSNDTLKMVDEGGGLYSWTIIPTEFYEVTAQEVYDKDIKFLVKPKDGGGYGDPDRKSDDLTVAVDPPDLTRKPAFLFPGRFQSDDLVMLYYDNNKEENPGMQNIASDEVYFFAEATLSDSTTVRIANNGFSVGNYPELKMDDYGGGIYKRYFFARKLFNVPPEKDIASITMYIQKKTFLNPTTDRIRYNVVANISCE